MGKWLPLAEFSYNNSYQESIKMVLFEALYGRKCRAPLNWIEPGERRYYGIDFVKEAEEQVQIIQQHIELLNQNKRVMQIRGEVLLCSKLEIMCI